ncbi:MAG: TRAP transporter small permease [Clostridia bacterium]|nr:TRAP transporter small permease [Clostridia bacterium]
MRNFCNMLNKVLGVLILITIIMLTLCTMLQVLSRFAIKIPLPWLQEVISLCFIWMICIGSAIGVKEKAHLGLDMLSSMLGKKNRLINKVFVDIVSMGTIGIFVYSAVEFFQKNMGKTAVTIDMPANAIYVSAVVCGVCMLIFILEILLDDIKALKAL